jgi:Transposase, Mutator family
VEISPQFVSRVTEELQQQIAEWPSRPLERVYPIFLWTACGCSTRARSDAIHSLEPGSTHLPAWFSGWPNREVSASISLAFSSRDRPSRPPGHRGIGPAQSTSTRV